MQKILTAAEMREVDRLTTEKYGIPSILLMENAAHAAARVIRERLGGSVAGKSFLILCGKGNNGGDGAALARILWTMDAYVEVYLFGKIKDTKNDARKNFEIIKRISGRKHPSSPYLFLKENEEIDAKNLGRFLKMDTVIDAVFGTGLTRPIDKSLSKLFHFFDCQKKLRKKSPLFVSIDVPSGLNADSAGKFENCFKADLTVTFTSPKPANILAPNYYSNGELFVVDIGSPYELIEESNSQLFTSDELDAYDWLRQTKFTSDSYKNKRGHALVVGGVKNYAGAAILAGNAAMVSGVGLATVAAPASVHNAIASRMLPEVMTRSVAETENGAIAYEAIGEILESIEGRIDAAAIGSGMSSSEESTRRFVREFVEKRKTPVVIDADGLNALAPFDLQGSNDLPLILTPHEGEFLKLLGTKDKDAVKDRVKAARDFAEKYNVILVLKGERSLIAAPDGRVVVNPTGNSGLGKAGNGDTLAGIIVGFVAQTMQTEHFKTAFESKTAKPVDKIFETVVAAVYLAGLAGDIAAGKHGKRSMLASDVRDCLTQAFQEIEKD